MVQFGCVRRCRVWKGDINQGKLSFVTVTNFKTLEYKSVMKTKPTRPTAFLEELQKLSDMFEHKRVAHHFRRAATEVGNEKAAEEEEIKLAEA